MKNNMKKTPISLIIFIILIICITFLVVAINNYWTKMLSYSDSDNTVMHSNSEPIVYRSPYADAFSNARAMVIGDCTAEGLIAYTELYDTNVIWSRGRPVLYINEDLDKAIEYKPNILFLSYGSNDLQLWNGNVDGFIDSYKDCIKLIRQVLPNTKIFINSILPVSDKSIKSDPSFAYEPLFNKKLKQLCTKENITYINNNKLLTQSPDGVIYETDGIHPRPFYYELWVKNMMQSANM